MTYPPPISRRRFLAQSSLLGVAGLGAPGLALGRPRSDRVKLALIGVGGRGADNLREMLAGGRAEVVALCDVSETHLARAGEHFPSARRYRDFRRLYDAAGSFDAVVISTPEHTHAVATMPALQLGKHVYCEKPLTHNILESRRIAEAAGRAGVATQMGTQIHGMPNYRRVVELIQAGAIGPVREVHVWVGRTWGLQSREEAERHKDPVHVVRRPLETPPPPADLDWDLWLGPAPARPFHDVYLPGPKWYRWWDFGSGTMSDLGSHWNDLPFWALKLDAPRTVEAFGPAPHAEIAPASMRVEYEYGPRGDMPSCRLTWYQGTQKPAIWEEEQIPQWPSGVLFVGDRGMLLSNYSKHVLLPEERFRDFGPPEPSIPDSPGQHQEWLIACMTGAPTGSPFSYAGPLTEANHLGNVAYRAARRLEWDAAAMRATNFPAAEQWIRREPRAGWSL